MLMMKNIHSKITLVFLLCFTLNLITNAQVHKYFIITGKVISDSQWIESGTIQIVKNDLQSVKVQIPKHGRFRLELDYNKDFKLIFSKKGCLSKTVHVNTEIPEEVVNQKSNLSHFLMAVELSKDTEEAYLMPEDQIQQIKYSPELNNFKRMSTILDQQFVENGKIIQNQPFQVQESKSKMQIHHIF
jgi:hypothetical protein